MRTIPVVDTLGTPCLLASEKGTLLGEEIKQILQTQPAVRVDFTGYEFLSTAFLNHALGQLCIDLNWDAKTFHDNVHIANMGEDDLEDLELAIDNAQTRRGLLLRGVDPDQYYSSRLPA